jgi:hypothetical protein
LALAAGASRPCPPAAPSGSNSCTLSDIRLDSISAMPHKAWRSRSISPETLIAKAEAVCSTRHPRRTPR